MNNDSEVKIKITNGGVQRISINDEVIWMIPSQQQLQWTDQQPNDQVQLVTHVQQIPQWNPNQQQMLEQYEPIKIQQNDQLENLDVISSDLLFPIDFFSNEEKEEMRINATESVGKLLIRKAKFPKGKKGK